MNMSMGVKRLFAGYRSVCDIHYSYLFLITNSDHISS
jgi:hypothetical protein